MHPVDIDHIPGSDELNSIPNYAVAREYRIVRKDEKNAGVHEVIRNICDESGTPFRVEGAIYGITDRKLAQEK